MTIATTSDHEQTKLWNGPAGRAWVDAQDLLDHALRPLQDALVEAVFAAGPRKGHHILDVGCGTGSTTVAMARRAGPGGGCVGVDISEPMIAAARLRAKDVPASFICADAQDHGFEPASFNAIASRLGVMFFDDPVRAFANLRRAATDGAPLAFIALRNAAENPFMTTAERAAAPLLPNLAPRKANAPGPFAFADQDRVHGILGRSGWSEIEISGVDLACSFPETELVRYVTRLGPVGVALHDADEQTRSHVIEVVRPAFDPFVHGPLVRFTASCWMVRARA
jgi:SAM-dependent methyltransferase